MTQSGHWLRDFGATRYGPRVALVSAGGQLFFTPNWSFEAKFDGEFSATSQTYAGTGTLRYTWLDYWPNRKPFKLPKNDRTRLHLPIVASRQISSAKTFLHNQDPKRTFDTVN